MKSIEVQSTTVIEYLIEVCQEIVAISIIEVKNITVLMVTNDEIYTNKW